MGVIGAQDKAPTSKFINPPNLATIQSNTDFTVQMAINNVSGNSRSPVLEGKELTFRLRYSTSLSPATLFVFGALPECVGCS